MCTLPRWVVAEFLAARQPWACEFCLRRFGSYDEAERHEHKHHLEPAAVASVARWWRQLRRPAPPRRDERAAAAALRRADALQSRDERHTPGKVPRGGSPRRARAHSDRRRNVPPRGPRRRARSAGRGSAVATRPERHASAARLQAWWRARAGRRQASAARLQTWWRVRARRLHAARTARRIQRWWKRHRAGESATRTLQQWWRRVLEQSFVIVAPVFGGAQR